MTDKIKIGVMTTSYPIEPSSVSGVFVKHLCDALEALGKFELTIVTPSYQVVERDNSSVKFVRYAQHLWSTSVNHHSSVVSL